jgi:hypothetical protein
MPVFQPFVRFEVDGQAVILGLATMPNLSTLPTKNELSQNLNARGRGLNARRCGNGRRNLTWFIKLASPMRVVG